MSFAVAQRGSSPRPAFLPVFPPRDAPWAEWREALLFTGYSLGNYLLLNVVEDPAWLALAFC
jgi:hypothetical protein